MEDNFSSLLLFDEQLVVSELFSCCTSSDNDQVGIILNQERRLALQPPPQNQLQSDADPRRTLQFYQQQDSLVSSSSSSSSANSSSSIILQDDEIITSNNKNKNNSTNNMMDDPLNAAGINNNNEEEDLDALLAQADRMISAASDKIVIDGFAIDSDEEDDADAAEQSRERARTASTGEDGDIVDVSMDSPQTERPLQNAPSSGNAPKVPIQPSEDPLLHLLHEDVVHQNTNNTTYTNHTMPSPNYNNGNSGPTQPTFHTATGPVGTAAAAVSHFPASVTYAMRNLGVGAVVTAANDPSSSLESQFKAQTSRFAANLSSMAQRVASAASNVTPTHANQMNGSFEGNFPPPMSVPTMMQQMQQQQQHHQSQFQPPGGMSTSSHSASTGSLNNSNNSPYASQSNSAHGMSTPSSSTTPVAPMLHFELDTEQKQALVEVQVGKLLPGEKVIMFLHNLLHVSDSTGFQYVANMSSSSSATTTTSTGGGTPVWCCAMTYFRLIVFGTTQEMIVHIMNTVHVNNPNNPTTTAATNTTSTATDSSPPFLQHASGAPSQWNASCWPPAFPTVMELPLSCMEKVEKTVYTASTHGSSPISPTTPSHQGRTTTLMGLQVWAKHGRYWRLTTPSYADTLRAHQALLTYAFPGRRNLGYLFAFESKRADVVNSVVTDPATGQKTVSLALVRKRFDAVVEFQRQFNRYNSNNNSSSNDQSPSTPSSPTNNATMDPNTTTPPTMKPPSVRPWKIWTQLNAQYQLCMSYPGVLVGPASLDEHNPDAVRLLQSCAAFRSEQRLPALAWASGMDGASIWRCSQPKIGLQGNRSSADELVIKHIMEAAKSANALREQPLPVRMDVNTMAAFTGANDLANSHWVKDAHCALKILDLRPRSAAMANRTGGYGYENTSNYPGTTLQFCNIGNIHAVRDAYQKMTALSLNTTNSTDVNWGSALEDTKWLSHIRIILAAAWETAFWVYVHRMPVLLHCSHGWDRTSQVSALAQLMLDPYYRTMEGFACLTEKDFMSFGHPFHTRCAHGEGKGGSGGGGVHHQDGVGGAGGIVGSSSDVNSSADEGQISPIFLQFLDCVWQMVHQYPECFEFTTDYLLELSEHIYSCRFGNMLCDTERERELVAGIRQRTYSVWDHLEQNPDDPNSDPKAKLWRNKQFDPSPNAGGGVLLMPMPTLLRNVTLWREKHAQYGPKATLRWRNSDQAHLWLPRPTETPVSS